MQNKVKVDWNTHCKNLETWSQPIAEYAKIHGLKAQDLYSIRSKLKKRNKIISNKTPQKVKSNFIPIQIPTLSNHNKIELKISKNNMIFEINGLTLLMFKELLLSI